MYFSIHELLYTNHIIFIKYMNPQIPSIQHHIAHNSHNNHTTSHSSYPSTYLLTRQEQSNAHKGASNPKCRFRLQKNAIANVAQFAHGKIGMAVGGHHHERRRRCLGGGVQDGRSYCGGDFSGRIQQGISSRHANTLLRKRTGNCKKILEYFDVYVLCSFWDIQIYIFLKDFQYNKTAYINNYAKTIPQNYTLTRFSFSKLKMQSSGVLFN